MFHTQRNSYSRLSNSPGSQRPKISSRMTTTGFSPLKGTPQKLENIQVNYGSQKLYTDIVNKHLKYGEPLNREDQKLQIQQQQKRAFFEKTNKLQVQFQQNRPKGQDSPSKKILLKNNKNDNFSISFNLLQSRSYQDAFSPSVLKQHSLNVQSPERENVQKQTGIQTFMSNHPQDPGNILQLINQTSETGYFQSNDKKRKVSVGQEKENSASGRIFNIPGMETPSFNQSFKKTFFEKQPGNPITGNGIENRQLKPEGIQITDRNRKDNLLTGLEYSPKPKEGQTSNQGPSSPFSQNIHSVLNYSIAYKDDSKRESKQILQTSTDQSDHVKRIIQYENEQPQSVNLTQRKKTLHASDLNNRSFDFINLNSEQNQLYLEKSPFSKRLKDPKSNVSIQVKSIMQDDDIILSQSLTPQKKKENYFSNYHQTLVNEAQKQSLGGMFNSYPYQTAAEGFKTKSPCQSPVSTTPRQVNNVPNYAKPKGQVFNSVKNIKLFNLKGTQ